jgi:small GTP-binding protein
MEELSPVSASSRKVVVVGGFGCGKTSLLRRCTDGDFNEGELPTLGVNIVIRKGSQVWDTSGQERFHSLAPTYLKGAHAVIFVYSIANYASFADLKHYWIPLVLKTGTVNLAFYMVGTKMDLEEFDGRREVSVQDAVELAAQFDFHYGETSAKSAHGIEHVKLFLEQQMPVSSADDTEPRINSPVGAETSERMHVLEPFPAPTNCFKRLFCACAWRRQRKYLELDT